MVSKAAGFWSNGPWPCYCSTKLNPRLIYVSELIVGFGEALVDVLPSGEVVGGAPLNFSLRAAQLSAALGWQAALVSRIGSDERGQAIQLALASSSLDITCLQIDLLAQTGYVDVTIQDGHPHYVIGPEVAWDHIAFDKSVGLLAQRASAVCFGTLAQRSMSTRDTLYRFLESAAQAIKILDINLRLPYPDLEIIRSSLLAADVLKCNSDELLLLAQWLGLEQVAAPAGIAAELQVAFGLCCVFWTRGASGCVLQRDRELTEGPVPALIRDPQADSVGAGDAASAALAVGLVAHWSDQHIVRVANYCGAFAASHRGATQPLPDDFLQQLE